MAGLDPAIHEEKSVDPRVKPGDDGLELVHPEYVAFEYASAMIGDLGRSCRRDAMPQFEKRRIGRTSLEVTVLGLGCATLGGTHIPVTRQGAEAMLKTWLSRTGKYWEWEVQDLLRLLALAHHAFRRDAGAAVGPGGVAVERRVRFLMGFGAHDVSDAEPLLVAYCTETGPVLPPVRTTVMVAKPPDSSPPNAASPCWLVSVTAPGCTLNCMTLPRLPLSSRFWRTTSVPPG